MMQRIHDAESAQEKNAAVPVVLPLLLWLVTIGGLGPCMLWCDDVWGDGEVSIKFQDVWFGSCGLSDAQARAVVGGKNDGAELMGFEGIADAGPGGVDALVEQGFFDRDEKMVGEQAKKDMRVGTEFEVVEDRSYCERRFHIAEGILGAAEQSVDTPELVG